MPNLDPLDQQLNADGQQAVRQVVRELPEESMSMAWRSDLNERLLQMTPAKRKRWHLLDWRPALGVGLAVVAFGFLILPNRSAPSANGTLEESLASVHAGAQIEAEFGSSMSAIVQNATGESGRPHSETWQVSDLELL